MFRPTNERPVCIANSTSSYEPTTTLPMSENMSSSLEFKTLGFIGLGAMGMPMLEHLINKLPQESRIWVYDVVEDVVDDMCAAFPEKVSKATSAKQVAQQAVCLLVARMSVG
jgi:ornithine cyclodeaminase/alanine dehydrogenase-like protein (mu-crystallin family)